MKRRNNDGEHEGCPDSVRLMLAYLCIEKEVRLETKVGILARFDLSNIEIASVCGSKVQ